MPRAVREEIELEYEVFGSDRDEPLLLIMGLGAQMLLWDDAFCEQLASRGHRVIRPGGGRTRRLQILAEKVLIAHGLSILLRHKWPTSSD